MYKSFYLTPQKIYHTVSYEKTLDRIVFIMSADYWISSQRMHWQFTKEQLTSSRYNIMLWEKQKVTNSSLMIRYDTSMRIFIHHMIARLGRRLSLRQVILSTAEVYISRFLIKVSLLEINIYMLVATCVYVACKICESPQHIRTILAEARNCWPEFISGDFTKLAEFEFYLIEELECYLIVHHPYNSLAQLVKVLGKASDLQQSDADSGMGSNGSDSNDERNSQYRVNLTDNEIENVWQVINDSYMTDLPLLYPPHIIAIAALHMVLALRVESPEGSVEPGLESTSMFSSARKGTKTSNGDPLLSFILDSNGKNNALSVSNGAAGHNDSNSNSNTPLTSQGGSAGGINGPFNSNSHVNNTGTGHGGSVAASHSGSGDDFGMGRRNNSASNGKNTIGLSTKGGMGHGMGMNGNYSQLGIRRKLSQSMSHGGRSLPRSGGNLSVSLSPDKPGFFGGNGGGGVASQSGNNRAQTARIEAFTNFLAGSNVNLEEVIESVQELLNLYEAWQEYDEGAIRQTVKNVLMTLHTRAAGLNGDANISHPSSNSSPAIGGTSIAAPAPVTANAATNTSAALSN